MGDWSRAEVEATVADYFDMLEREIRGLDYNKSAHRRALSPRLSRRSDGAIERKHQNISAILIEAGFVYISGYKPLGNYQRMLQDVVVERLAASRELVSAVEQQVAESAEIPSIDDILSALTQAPTSSAKHSAYPQAVVNDRAVPRPGIDYLALEARNRSLGDAGEEFVVRYEVARLSVEGRERLAGKVERVSKTRGDGLGYDVLSFDGDGKERLIEVKTTRYGASTPFYVTRRELALSRQESDRFHLYRAFDFRRMPRLFVQAGALERSFGLEPSQYMATIR